MVLGSFFLALCPQNKYLFLSIESGAIFLLEKFFLSYKKYKQEKNAGEFKESISVDLYLVLNSSCNLILY